MKNKSIVREKSMAFALAIIDLYKVLIENREYVISRQLLKSATSIGANISESLAGQSDRDFLHKMALASKESRETFYWLELLQESQIIHHNFKQEMVQCEELIRMLTAIVKTTSLKVKTKN